MTKEEYRQYLRSDHWRSIVAQAYQYHGRKCMACGVTKGLRVRHRHKGEAGHERVEDLMVLCERCFKAVRAYRANVRRIQGDVQQANGLIDSQINALLAGQRKQTVSAGKQVPGKKNKKHLERRRLAELKRFRAGKIYDPLLGTWSSKPVDKKL